MTWNPPIQSLADYGGDQTLLMSAVEERYLADWHSRSLTFEGLPVFPLTRPAPNTEFTNGTLWHLASDGPYGNVEKEALRKLDAHRLERVCWAKLLIDLAAARNDGVTAWYAVRHGVRKVAVAPIGWEMRMILERKRDGWMMVTAYPHTRDSQRKSLLNEYIDAKIDRKVIF